VPLRFGWDVRTRVAQHLPQTYAAAACFTLPAPDGRETALYLRQWVNPQPDKAVAALQVVGGDAPGTLYLAGAAAREVGR
jgi:hypothetical protein